MEVLVSHLPIFPLVHYTETKQINGNHGQVTLLKANFL